LPLEPLEYSPLKNSPMKVYKQITEESYEEEHPLSTN